MKIQIKPTRTMVITDIDRLDPVTAYITNYGKGQGKVVLECYGESWCAFWGGMGDRTLEEFFVSCHNEYIIGKMLSDTTETDFDLVSEQLKSAGHDICVTSDVEIAMCPEPMADAFGSEWFLDLPRRKNSKYQYLDRIITSVKQAFEHKLNEESLEVPG